MKKTKGVSLGAVFKILKALGYGLEINVPSDKGRSISDFSPRLYDSSQ